MEKKKVLGRGLESLLGGRKANLGPMPRAASVENAENEVYLPSSQSVQTTALAVASAHEAASGGVIAMPAAANAKSLDDQVAHIEIAVIDRNPYQTRSLFDEAQLAELAESIKSQGVVQPVVVRPAKEEGRYVLVLGERRLRASKLAGQTTIPAMVRRVSDQQAAELTVIENLQRQDLNTIEQAEAFRVLSRDFNLTQLQIAERVGLSRESVANYMRILRLPERVKEYLAKGDIRFSEAKELLRLEDADEIARLAAEIVKNPVTIGELADRVNAIRDKVFLAGAQSAEPSATLWIDPNVRAAQTDLERVLGLRVKIRDRNGKGKIEIQYGSVEDYERVVELLRGK